MIPSRVRVTTRVEVLEPVGSGAFERTTVSVQITAEHLIGVRTHDRTQLATAAARAIERAGQDALGRATEGVLAANIAPDLSDS